MSGPSRPNRSDRRSVSVYPTPAAKHNLADVRTIWADFLTLHVDRSLDVVPAIETLRAINDSIVKRDRERTDGASEVSEYHQPDAGARTH